MEMFVDLFVVIVWLLNFEKNENSLYVILFWNIFNVWFLFRRFFFFNKNLIEWLVFWSLFYLDKINRNGYIWVIL